MRVSPAEPTGECRQRLHSLTEVDNCLQVKPASQERRDWNHVFIRLRLYSRGMLFLSAFARIVPRDPEPNDLLAESHAVLGHVGLTIIAIVFVLVTFWKS